MKGRFDLTLGNFDETPLDAPYATASEPLRMVEEAFSTFRAFAGAADEDACIALSCETEAFVQVLLSLYMEVGYETGKNHVVVFAGEKASILTSLSVYEKLGICFDIVKLDSSGAVDLSDLQKKMNPKTFLAAFSGASSLTGVIQPVWEIARLCKEKQVPVYMDGSELSVSNTYQFRDLDIDYLALSGDKLFAPSGIALLFAKPAAPLLPLLGSSKFQGGKRLMPIGSDLIQSLAKALGDLMEMKDTSAFEVTRLRNGFEKKLRRFFPDLVVHFEAKRLFYVSCIALPKVHGEHLLFRLQEKGIFAALGGSREQKLPYLLMCIGIAPELAYSSLTFNFSVFHSEEEVETLVQTLGQVGLDVKKAAQELWEKD
ncbi:MAG: hypothetical protein A3F09_06145 [Chlamydiae bacterium RIFCSPHIGHO2_12_FULL_49_11]|nr:MAG: hypothetical protein A3F09_06145 [Chlamydiae bacterium RIFCSPHIGHO2_12_FULL_49_11]